MELITLIYLAHIAQPVFKCKVLMILYVYLYVIQYDHFHIHISISLYLIVLKTGWQIPQFESNDFLMKYSFRNQYFEKHSIKLYHNRWQKVAQRYAHVFASMHAVMLSFQKLFELHSPTVCS